jgi:hypothetical protein
VEHYLGRNFKKFNLTELVLSEVLSMEISRLIIFAFVFMLSLSSIIAKKTLSKQSVLKMSSTTGTFKMKHPGKKPSSIRDNVYAF